jgi:hypothetical protein
MRCGGTDRCAEIANARSHETLTDLRTCLFFEQRRYRHLGEEPSGDNEQYVRNLLLAIRRPLISND